MKLHIEISKEKRSEIERNIKKYLLVGRNNAISVIESAEFTEEEVIVKCGLFKKNKTIIKTFVINFEFEMFNPDYGDIRTTSNESIIKEIITYTDFDKGRVRWIKLKEMLQAFNLEFSRIETEPVKSAADEIIDIVNEQLLSNGFKYRFNAKELKLEPISK